MRGTSLLRTRSYSKDSWLNSPDDFYEAKGADVRPAYYKWGPYKISQHDLPPPSGVFAFIDEHEQSIDAGWFMIEQPPWITIGTDSWLSLAADRHEQGCNLSFLDEHVEHWRWKAPKIYKGWGGPPTSGGDLDDLRRIQEALPHDLK